MESLYEQRLRCDREALATPPEGQEIRVPYRGSVVDILTNPRTSVIRRYYAGCASLSDARDTILKDPLAFLVPLSESARKRILTDKIDPRLAWIKRLDATSGASLCHLFSLVAPLLQSSDMSPKAASWRLPGVGCLSLLDLLLGVTREKERNDPPSLPSPAALFTCHSAQRGRFHALPIWG